MVLARVMVLVRVIVLAHVMVEEEKQARRTQSRPKGPQPRSRAPEGP